LNREILQAKSPQIEVDISLNDQSPTVEINDKTDEQIMKIEDA